MEAQNVNAEANKEDCLTPEQLTDEYNQEVADFFELDPIENIELRTFSSKEDLFKYYQELSPHPENEPPSYLVAFSPGNLIAILNKDVMPSDTEPGPERFKKVLKHEIVHKYISQLKGNPPAWLVEGTCCYIADQSKGTVEEGFINIALLDELSWTQDGRKYWIGRNMVDLIMEKTGRKKLLELLEMEDQKEINIELRKLFEWLK